jgi:hypothetical protein
MQANVDIRQTANAERVKLWQIADRLGYTDATFSRKLRHELPDPEKAKIKAIIAELKAGA